MKAYELGQYEKSMPNDLTWKEKLQLCREFGFDYLEMSVDESEEKLASPFFGSSTILEISTEKAPTMITGIRVINADLIAIM